MTQFIFLGLSIYRLPRYLSDNSLVSLDNFSGVSSFSLFQILKKISSTESPSRIVSANSS